MLRPSLSEAEIEPVFQRLRTHRLALGGSEIVRALPTAGRRHVGPWVFLDAFGPTEALFDVGSHPHLGIATVTWLIQGRIRHRDSLGSDTEVVAGELSLMTAGRGLCHTETAIAGPIQGVQLWMALPPGQRGRVPGYHVRDGLPIIEEDGGTLTVVMGDFQGFSSPVATPTPTVLYQVSLDGRFDLTLSYPLEHGLYVLDGELQCDGEVVRAGEMVYFGMRSYGVQLDGRATVIVVGGEPLQDPFVMWWNFLAADADTIALAREQWNSDDGEFGEVPGAERLLAPALTGRPG